jgi:hypothetical protein
LAERHDQTRAIDEPTGDVHQRQERDTSSSRARQVSPGREVSRDGEGWVREREGRVERVE